jgi:hypothetical protein
MPLMTSNGVHLSLSGPVRSSLVGALRAALELRPGQDVDERLDDQPWGDIDKFRAAVHDPLHTRDHTASGAEPRIGVFIPEADVSPLRTVLDDLSECYSGGAPWGQVSSDERRAIEGVLAQLESA